MCLVLTQLFHLSMFTKEDVTTINSEERKQN